MTSATNYALIATHLRDLGIADIQDWPALLSAVQQLDNSVLKEWLEQERRDGKDVVLMTNFHLREGAG